MLFRSSSNRLQRRETSCCMLVKRQIPMPDPQFKNTHELSIFLTFILRYCCFREILKYNVSITNNHLQTVFNGRLYYPNVQEMIL